MTTNADRIFDAKNTVETFIEVWKDKVSTDDQAFRNFAVEQILWDLNLSDVEIEFVGATDGADDKGIDGWHTFVDDEITWVTLIKSKDTNSSPDDLDKLFTNFQLLFESSSNVRNTSNREIKDRAFTLDGLLSDTSRNFVFEIWLVTSRLATKNVKDRARDLSHKGLKLDGRQFDAEVNVFDIEDFAATAGTNIRSQVTFGTEVNSNHLMVVEARDVSFKTVTVVTPASELARLYEQERISLFKLNPRYYQSGRTKTNKNIPDTLSDALLRNHFYVYNNGLTATANSVTVSTRAKDPLKFECEED